MSTVIKTIADLKAAIQDLPDNLRVQGYDGSDRDCLVSVYVNDYDDVEETPKPSPALVVDVDN